MNLQQKGSQTAKYGFQNEKDICNKFKNWKEDKEAQIWLKEMGYNLSEIEYIIANIIHGYKSDINIQIKIKVKKAIDTENIQVKLVSNKQGFNQVDKRYLEKYHQMWSFSENVYNLLQFFVGEKKPYKEKSKSEKRMFINEFNKEEQNLIINWFENNKTLIISDILKGRGQFAVEWILVVQKVENHIKYKIININSVLQYYCNNPVKISPRGSICIGNLTIQRKGGDAGRDTAKMLQFKINPVDILNL